MTLYNIIPTMTRNIILILVFGYGAYGLNAQTPMPIQVNGDASIITSRKACSDQYAGTTTISNPMGSSNQLSGNPMMLCFGDSFETSISGQDLTGDPVVGTAPGVGFAVYDCPPTVSGPDLATIITDPCIADTGTPPTDGILVSTQGTTTGSQTFENDGTIQTNFNGGAPVQLWFAPITFDALNGTSAVFEGAVGSEGPCVNANTDDIFSVVYLNALTVSNSSPGNCSGSFRILGGASEFDGSLYTVDISLASDPNVKGFPYNLDNEYVHDRTIYYHISDPGSYIFTITDNLGCQVTFIESFSGCTDNVGIFIPDVTGAVGDTVCLPVTVSNFTNIESIQMNFEWDNSIVEFVGLNNPMTLTGFNSADFLARDVDTYQLSWFNFFSTVTLPDGETIFEICLEIVGSPGQTSPVRIAAPDNGVEIFNSSGTNFNLAPGSGNGSVTIVNAGPIDYTLDITDEGCENAMDGEVAVTINDGAEPFLVELLNAAGTVITSTTVTNLNGTATFDMLSEGEYTIRITDNDNDSASELFDIESYPTVSVNLIVTPSPCFGQEGQACAEVAVDAVVVPQNQLGNFSFIWNNGASTPCISSGPGPYGVTVTDSYGCTSTAAGNINQPAPLVINEVVVDAQCLGVNDGSIQITPSGGTPNSNGGYSYQWSNTQGVFTAAISVNANLEPGTYYVTVSDENNCQVPDSFTVNALKVVQLSSTIDNVSCLNGGDGVIEITVSASPGTLVQPLTYSWSPAGTIGNYMPPNMVEARNLPQGNYGVTISDGDGCEVSENDLVVTQPATALTISLAELNHVSCAGNGSDGSIIVTASGGVPLSNGSYNYVWNTVPAQTTNVASDLPPGTYTVTVTDLAGCEVTLTETVTIPVAPSITGFDVVDVVCPNDLDGSLAVNSVQGSSAIVNYDWDNSFTGQTINNIGAGPYCVTITDEAGCTADDCAIVTATGGITVSDLVLNPTCAGGSDGVISLNLTGGFMPYNYAWSAGGSGNSLTNATAGTYTVTISDNGTCPAVVNEYTLVDPAAIVTSISELSQSSCFNGSVADGVAEVIAAYSDGSPGNFTFNWTGAGNPTSTPTTSSNDQLLPGYQYVNISDNNCTVTDSILITTPDTVTVDFTLTEPDCFGDTNGTIEVTGEGGTGSNYSFLWDYNNTAGPSLNMIPAGPYQVTVTDAVGCSNIESIGLTQPDLLDAMIESAATIDVNCYGDTTGQIGVNVLGGNGSVSTDYTYNWSGNVSSSAIAVNLPAGVYEVTVLDSKGCSDTLSHEIFQNPPLFFELDPILDPECYGYQTILTLANVTGGSGDAQSPYLFSVDFFPPQPIDFGYHVFAGEHTVIVYDAFDCSADTTFTITEPDPIIVELPDLVELNLGESVLLNPLVGAPLGIDTLYWSPDSLLSDPTSLRPYVEGLKDNQVFELVVVDPNGCSASDEVLVELDRDRNVYIPNIFAPLGSGQNAVFNVYNGPGVKNIEFIRIFDRWGNLIFEREDLLPAGDNPAPTDGWDGTYNGTLLNPGVFAYLVSITFVDDVTLLYRGDITLIK